MEAPGPNPGTGHRPAKLQAFPAAKLHYYRRGTGPSLGTLQTSRSLCRGRRGRARKALPGAFHSKTFALERRGTSERRTIEALGLVATCRLLSCRDGENEPHPHNSRPDLPRSLLLPGWTQNEAPNMKRTSGAAPLPTYHLYPAARKRERATNALLARIAVRRSLAIFRW